MIKSTNMKGVVRKIDNITLNPFDALAEEAVKEYKEGRTGTIEEYVKNERQMS